MLSCRHTLNLAAAIKKYGLLPRNCRDVHINIRLNNIPEIVFTCLIDDKMLEALHDGFKVHNKEDAIKDQSPEMPKV